MTKAPYFFIDLANLPDTLVWVASDPAAIQQILSADRIIRHLGVGFEHRQAPRGFHPLIQIVLVRPRHHSFQHISTGLSGGFGHVDLPRDPPLPTVRGAASALRPKL